MEKLSQAKDQARPVLGFVALPRPERCVSSEAKLGGLGYFWEIILSIVGITIAHYGIP